MNATCYDRAALRAYAAASLIGCEIEDLLNFRFDRDDNQFIAIAPSGQKHRFDIDTLEAALSPSPAERGRAGVGAPTR